VEKELRKRGLKVNRKRIARLLRKYNLNARSRRKYIKTADSERDEPACANILNREFRAAGPGDKWVSDITYLRTTSGRLYLTVVLDLFDRKIIGWAFSRTTESDATALPALIMAFTNRRPKEDFIFHSDRGVQYRRKAFRDTLRELRPKARQSMSRKGNCWDNACAESFFKTLKRELETLDGKHSAGVVKLSVFEYIECYYNRIRLHSALDYSTPVEVLPAKTA
jgi:transposase InsO family protein